MDGTPHACAGSYSRPVSSLLCWNPSKDTGFQALFHHSPHRARALLMDTCPNRGGSLYDSVRYNFIAPLSGTPHVLSDLACPINFFSLFIANERSANDFSTSNNTYITYGVSHRTPKIKYYCAFQKTSVGWGKIFGTPLERNMFCFGIRNLRNVGRR